jgi:hypothetical protein
MSGMVPRLPQPTDPGPLVTQVTAWFGYRRHALPAPWALLFAHGAVPLWQSQSQEFGSLSGSRRVSSGNRVAFG